jgi:hypothetical protein
MGLKKISHCFFKADKLKVVNVSVLASVFAQGLLRQVLIRSSYAGQIRLRLVFAATGPSSLYDLPISFFELPTSLFELPASLFELPASLFELRQDKTTGQDDATRRRDKTMGRDRTTY